MAEKIYKNVSLIISRDVDTLDWELGRGRGERAWEMAVQMGGYEYHSAIVIMIKRDDRTP